MADNVASSDLEACRSALRTAGLRITSARLRVLQIVRKADRPLSHADVFDMLGEHAQNRSTVWRNLGDLEAAGLVRRTELGDRRWRFERAARGPSHDDRAHPHPHFICTQCGDVSCLPDDLLSVSGGEDVPDALQKGRVEVQIRGLCDECE